jgi:release factor glutamine methyltransferase
MLSLTWKELFDKTRENLSQNHSPQAQNSLAYRLLEWTSGFTRTQLSLNWDLLVAPNFFQKWEGGMKRLLSGEPIQYIEAFTPFSNLLLKVHSSALIPRPETEELVQLILAHHPSTEKISVLDIGTGTGCIGLALKYARPSWEIVATDISAQALDLAKENARLSGLSIEFRQLNLLSASVNEYPEVNIIVSNPPYIPAPEIQEMDRSVSAFEPHIALFTPAGDPQCFYRAIAKLTSSKLKDEGEVWVEGHRDYLPETKNIFERHGFKKVTLIKDYNDNLRFLHALK